MPQPKPPVENERHRKAFEVYFALGDRRTYKMAADRLGVSASTIKLWSRTFGWGRRVAERDAEVARQASEKSMTELVTETDRNLKMIRAAKNKMIKDIIEGKTKSSVSELAKCIKLERKIQSQPDPTVPVGSDPNKPQVILYLPDSGIDPKCQAPVFVLPDNGSSPEDNPPEGDSNEPDES